MRKKGYHHYSLGSEGKLLRSIGSLACATAGRLCSVPIKHSRSAEVYARRVANSDAEGHEIHYIGTPARYNQARLLPYLIPTAAAIAVPAALGALYYESVPAASAIWIWVCAVLFSAAALAAAANAAPTHMQRVFTVTGRLIMDEGPASGRYLPLERVEALLMNTHHDATVTVTAVLRYTPDDSRRTHALRRLDHHQAHALVTAVCENSYRTPDIYFRTVAKSTLTARPDAGAPPLTERKQ